MQASRADAAKRTVLVFEGGRGSPFLCNDLEAEGYAPSPTGSTLDALERLRLDMPDLVVLDAVEESRGEFVRQIRDISDVPVVVIGPADETAAIDYLENGADDYLARPFSARELSSRLGAVLRRAEMPAPVGRRLVRIDDFLQIDFSKRTAVVGGRQVHLRPTEFRLLYHLVSNSGRVLSHATLLAKVWGFEQRAQTHYLRLYIRYLRERIEPSPANPRYILNERGVGYRFTEF